MSGVAGAAYRAGADLVVDRVPLPLSRNGPHGPAGGGRLARTGRLNGLTAESGSGSTQQGGPSTVKKPHLPRVRTAHGAASFNGSATRGL